MTLIERERLARDYLGLAFSHIRRDPRFANSAARRALRHANRIPGEAGSALRRDVLQTFNDLRKVKQC